MKNLIATYTDDLGENFKLVEIDGTIFSEDNEGNQEYVLLNPHNGNDCCDMNRESVEAMGYEIESDSDMVFLPSGLFFLDAFENFGMGVALRLAEFFKKELQKADKREREFADLIDAEN